MIELQKRTGVPSLFQKAPVLEVIGLSVETARYRAVPTGYVYRGSNFGVDFGRVERVWEAGW